MKIEFGKQDGGAGTSSAPVIEVKSETTPGPEGVSGPIGPVGSPGPTSSPGHLGEQGPSSVPEIVQSSVVREDQLPAFSEVMLPRLNLVHDIGDLKDSFSPGSLVWNQQTVLYTPPVINAKTGNVEGQGTAPVILTVLGEVQKRFAEIVIGGARGMLVNTESDVRAAGGTLDWQEWNLKKAAGMKRFGPLLDLLVVIQRPETVKDDDTVFGFECDGKKYALGLWSLSKTGYTEAYKKVFGIQRHTGVIKGKRSEGGGYPVHSFAVSTRLQPYGEGKKSWVPVVIPNAKSTPAFLQFVNQILNPAG